MRLVRRKFSFAPKMEIMLLWLRYGVCHKDTTGTKQYCLNDTRPLPLRSTRANQQLHILCPKFYNKVCPLHLSSPDLRHYPWRAFKIILIYSTSILQRI